MESLLEEQKRLEERLKLINVNSPGRNHIIERLKAINQELKQDGYKAI